MRRVLVSVFLMASLSGVAAVTFVGQRQTALRQTYEAALLAPPDEGVEAGLACFMTTAFSTGYLRSVPKVLRR